MGFKEFFKKTMDNYKEQSKPENVKRRLKDKIEIEGLRAQKEAAYKDRKRNEGKYRMGGF